MKKIFWSERGREKQRDAERDTRRKGERQKKNIWKFELFSGLNYGSRFNSSSEGGFVFLCVFALNVHIHSDNDVCIFCSQRVVSI